MTKTSENVNVVSIKRVYFFNMGEHELFSPSNGRHDRESPKTTGSHDLLKIIVSLVRTASCLFECLATRHCVVSCCDLAVISVLFG